MNDNNDNENYIECSDELEAILKRMSLNERHYKRRRRPTYALTLFFWFMIALSVSGILFGK